MAFPPHESITTTVCAEGASLDVALSLGTPFKTLYSVYALKVCLLHQLQNVCEPLNSIDQPSAEDS